MIAQCTNPKCRLVFNDTSGIDISNAYITIRGSIINCPRCGSIANFLEGKFHVNENGLITFLSGPHITHEILLKLRLLTEEAIKNNYTNELFLEKAKNINPALHFLKEFLPKDVAEWRNYFFTLLVSIIGPIIYDIVKPKEPAPPIIQNIYNNITSKKILMELPKKTFVPKSRKPIKKKLRILKK